MNYQRILEKHALFTPLQRAADDLGLSTYVVGGFVRDAFLQRPCKDVDIVCVGDGIALAEAFAKRVKVPLSQIHIFKNFGTAMLRYKGWEIEFVGARKESYARDSRKPEVRPGSLEDDILRRDFKVNALAIQLNKAHWGDLVDLCGGMEALDQGILSTPLAPGKTFSDDPLRMLRCIRFATQLGFKIAPETWEAIQAEHERLAILSKERISGELNKIMKAGRPDAGFYLLDESGLLTHILPELQALKGKERRGRHTHKENFIHTLQVLRNVAEVSEDLWLRWAALLHDIAKPATKRFDPRFGFTFHGHEMLGAKMVVPIFRRLRLPMKKEMRYVQKLVRLHLRHIPLIENEVTPSAIRRFIHDAGEVLGDLLMLCKADITSGNAKKVATYRANFDILAKKIMEVEEQDRIRTLEPVIGGKEIMDLFRIPPSPPIGKIKAYLKNLVLDGEVENSQEALYPYLLEKAKTLGLVPPKKEDHDA